MNRIPMPSSAAPARPRGAGAPPPGAPRRFTLIEMLFVISIILILLGTAVNGQKRLAREAALTTRYAAVQQLVNDTVQSAKRLRAPIQMNLVTPSDVQSGICELHGGAGTVVSYWGFNSGSNVGLYNQTIAPLSGPMILGEGFLGLGANFTTASSNPLVSSNSFLMNYPNGVYIETWFKPNCNEFNNEVGILNIGPAIMAHPVDKGVEVWGQYGSSCVPPSPSTGGYRPSIPNDDQWHKAGLRIGRGSLGVGNWSSLADYGLGSRVTYVVGTQSFGWFEALSDPPIGDKPLTGTSNETLNGNWKRIYNWEMELYVDDRYITKAGPPLDANIGFTNLTIGSNGYRGLVDEIRIINYGLGATVASDPRDSFFAASGSYITISPSGAPAADASVAVVSQMATATLLGWTTTAQTNNSATSKSLNAPSNTPFVIRAQITTPSVFAPSGGHLYFNGELISYESLVYNSKTASTPTSDSTAPSYEFVNCIRYLGGTSDGSTSSSNTLYFTRPVILNRSGGRM